MAIDPGTAAIASSVIQAGAGLFGSRKTPSLTKEVNHSTLRLQKQQERWNEWAFNTRNKKFRLAAADAKAAGLHPLFALGTGVTMSGGAPSGMGALDGGQHESGSLAGTALNAVGQGLRDYAKATAKDPLQQKQLDLIQSQIDLNRANHDLALSRAAGELQKANHTRPAVSPDGVQVFPYNQAPPTYERLPVRVEPRELHPNKVQAHGKGGRDHYSYAPPGLGGDEINQIIWLMNRAIEHGSDAAARWFPQGRGNRPPTGR